MERISALLDGELQRPDAARLITDLTKREELRAAWSTYHLIGEAMRRQPCTDCGVARTVSEKLIREPVQIAPRAASAATMGARWLWPGLAAAAAVATVTWMVGGVHPPAVTPPVGPLPVALVVDTGQVKVLDTAWMLSEAGVASQPSGSSLRLSENQFHPYLMAHQPFSPSLSIQGLVPYVRTVAAPSNER